MNYDNNYLEHLNKGRETQTKLKNEIKEAYYKNPNKCIECDSPIDFYKRLKSKFCSRSCSAKYNNIYKKREKTCKYCKSKFITTRENRNNIYCNTICASKHIQEKTLNKIKLKLELNELNYLTNSNSIPYKTTIKKIIANRDGNKCSICSMPNEWEFKPIVMILDHIDGNSENNDLTNLRLVCPNCDSQLPTFKGRNTGNGRFSRRERYKNKQSY